MFTTYGRQIAQYCRDAGVDIPVGFQRHRAYQYAAIDNSESPPKLVATTWSAHQDVVNFLLHQDDWQSTRILDFNSRRELTFNGADGLVNGALF